MKIPELIKDTRLSFRQTQTDFGTRFGVQATAVSLWESGQREAPYKVIEFCMEHKDKYIVCTRCLGKGVIERDHPISVGTKIDHSEDNLDMINGPKQDII